MALSGTARAKIAKMLEVAEGRVPHFYRDSNHGLITIGIGCKFDKAAEAASLPMFSEKDKKKATAEDIATEFQAVLDQPKGMSWKKYQYKLVISNGDINVLLNQSIDEYYRELRARYSSSRGYEGGFDAFPVHAQLALFDMMYNLGGPSMMKFKAMNSAIKARDWAEAGENCRRKGPSADRNTLTRKLFRKAGALDKTEADAS